MIGMKALLIVSALAGGGDYTTEMPNMDTCMKARDTIFEQDNTLKTICVPMQDESQKVETFFTLFMKMINQMKEFEELERLNREEDCERPFGALDCKEPMG